MHVLCSACRVVSTGKCLVAGSEFPTFTLRAGTPRGLVQLVLRLETHRDLRFWVNSLVGATRAAIESQNVLLFRALPSNTFTSHYFLSF